MRTVALLFCVIVPLWRALASEPDAGQRLYEARCAGCHGTDGNGGQHAPSLVTRLPARNDQELATVIREGLPTRGMPPSSVNDKEMRVLVGYLRTLRALQHHTDLTHESQRVLTTDGHILEGQIINQGMQDLQLRTHDHRVYLLRKVGDRYRVVTSQKDWPTYNGQWSGNRYSTLDQIDKDNVARLAPVWLFSIPSTQRLQTTPVVVEGIMYVTSANECYALDAGSGRQIWHFQRPRTQGLVGNAAGGINRGVAIAGERLFMVTDHAHLLALHRLTGELLWETAMADWRQNYNATSAPLVARNLVVSGTAGGEQGVRGFLAAYDQATGKEVWRFWTVPKPGEAGSETWVGKDIEHGGAPTWLTGSYDPELAVVYWATGNASPNLNGDQRLGDNLYTCSVLALDIKTGRLKWYYQFTPHDEWDWDAQEPLVLVDVTWEGHFRKLLLHANRNGFFYVLDRTDGKLLLAKPFVKKLTWAREIGADGRPVMNPDQRPTPEGTRICPSLNGATNWFSTSFNPATGLYYVQTLEECAIFAKTSVKWAAGQRFWGGTTRQAPHDIAKKILRAIDIKTGESAWELPQTGRGGTSGGILSTASGLVFFGEDSGSLMAVDAARGTPLWHFQANQRWEASPMTYMFDSRQYLAIAAGGTVISFALTK